MGTYRTVNTTLRCLRCGAASETDVQFKTGSDGAMPVYRADSLVLDAAPGRYAGIADAFCAECQSLWVELEKRAHFEQLADEAQRGSLSVSSGERSDTRTLDPAAIRALALIPEQGSAPSFSARLHSAGVALGFDSAPSARDDWWRAHEAAVNERLRRQGWVTGSDPYRELTVTIAADGRLRVEENER